MQWCSHEIVRDADVARLVKRIRDRVVRRLRQLGKWPDEGEEPEVSGDEEQLLLELGSAAVQGRTALGERAGARDGRPGRGTRDEPNVLAGGAGPLRRRGFGIGSRRSIASQQVDRCIDSVLIVFVKSAT